MKKRRGKVKWRDEQVRKKRGAEMTEMTEEKSQLLVAAARLRAVPAVAQRTAATRWGCWKAGGGDFSRAPGPYSTRGKNLVGA